MKKFLFLVLFFAFCMMGFGQTLLFEEYFDDGVIPATWANIDKDADTNTWYGATWKNSKGYIEGYVVSESWNSVVHTLTPENYLISPRIDLTRLQGSVSLRYSIQVLDPQFPAEHYKVAVSTTGNAVDDFTNIVKDETCTSADYFFTDPFWHTRNIDLTPFIGQQIYLTFCHFNCTDMYAIFLDSVQVSYTTNVSLFKQSEAYDVITYPNPVKSNLQISGTFANAKIELIAADGRQVYRTDKVTNQKSINVSSFKNGVYLLRLQSAKGIVTKKINISH